MYLVYFIAYFKCFLSNTDNSSLLKFNWSSSTLCIFNSDLPILLRNALFFFQSLIVHIILYSIDILSFVSPHLRLLDIVLFVQLYKLDVISKYRSSCLCLEAFWDKNIENNPIWPQLGWLLLWSTSAWYDHQFATLNKVLGTARAQAHVLEAERNSQARDNNNIYRSIAQPFYIIQ